MPRPSRVSRMRTTWGRSFTSRSSSRMPSQTVSSRSQTTHLMDCFSFFFAASTAAAWDVTSKLLKLKEREGDLLDLRAPLDDLGHLGVAQVAGHWIVLGEAVGAVDLHGVVGRPGGRTGGEVLGRHRLHERPGVARVAQPAPPADRGGG